MDSNCVNIINKLNSNKNLKKKCNVSKCSRKKVLKSLNGWWDRNLTLLYERDVGEGKQPLITKIVTQMWLRCENINCCKTSSLYSGMIFVNVKDLPLFPNASLPPNTYTSKTGEKYIVILKGGTIHYNESTCKYEIFLPQFTNKSVWKCNFAKNTYNKLSGIGYELSDPDPTILDGYVGSVEAFKIKTPVDFIGEDFDDIYQEIYSDIVNS